MPFFPLFLLPFFEASRQWGDGQGLGLPLWCTIDMLMSPFTCGEGRIAVSSTEYFGVSSSAPLQTYPTVDVEVVGHGNEFLHHTQ